MSANPIHALMDLAAHVGAESERGTLALFTGRGAVRAAEVLARGVGRELRVLDAESQAARDLAVTESASVSLLVGAASVDPADLDHLLERVEARPGLVILSTRRKDSLEAAFVRRLRFVIDFPADPDSP